LSAPAPALVTQKSLPLWELGVGGVTGSQQAYPGASQQTTRTLVLPYAIYRGQVLRTDGGTVGLRALRTPRFEFDLGVGGSLGSSSSRIEARRGMPDLGTLVEAGPSLRWNLAGIEATGAWRLDLPLRAVFDLSDGMARRGLAFEPWLRFDVRNAGWSWSAGGGAFVGNRKLADTFYGVAPIYATAERPAYEAKSGLIAWRLAGTVSRNFTPDLRAFVTVRMDSVAGAANENSPLVRQTNGWSGGLGFVYTLKTSSQPAFD
jgi:outer membrane scaffolding protein for murein synthesis (MipA/OmpV family)